MNVKSFLFVLVGIGTLQTSTAQFFSGLQNSNFVGVNGIYTNPASVTLMTHKRSANIGTFGFEVSNNYLTLNAPFSMWQLISGSVGNEYRDQNGKIDWKESWLKQDDSRTSFDVNLSSEVRGPAYVNQYGRFVWGTATRTRSHVNIEDMSVGLWSWGKQWIDSQQMPNPLNLVNQSFKLNANSYQELSALFGMRVLNNSNMKLGVAGTLKGIFGLGSVNLSSTGAQFSLSGMDTLVMNSGRMEMAYTDNNLLGQLFRGVFTGSLPRLGEINGFGYGLDLGISIEIGEDMDTEFNNRQGFKDYTFKFGAAILDLGQVSYRNQNEGYIIDADRNPFKLALNNPEFLLASQSGTQAVLEYARKSAESQNTLQSNNERTTVVLPSTLQLQADWRIMPGFLVAGHWQQALHIAQKWEFSQHHQLAIVPRFEHKWFEFAMPVRYQSLFNRVSLGAHTRLGPVFLGTDNLGNIFKTASYSGMTFYLGVATLIK